MRRVESALHKPRPVGVNGFELPLEPREAGQAHLSPQPQQPTGLDLLDRQKSSASPT